MSSHTTLYRKWRPADFSSVVGQNHITEVLKYQVNNNKTSHAYLFCGSRGTGKTTCAKILSKAINCLSPKNGDPCGECEACKLIESGSATDVIEMDAASNNGVDYIRDIREDVVYSPASLKKRIYIIDEVHMLSSGAFNALLKTLEEPPAHVVFILATTELQKLPATITSRCQRFDFRRISSDDIASRLEFIASKENISVTHEAANLIGRISSGGMRDAISLLELCSGKNKSINIALVNETAGVMGRDKTAATVTAIMKKDIPTIFSIIDEISTASSDILNFISELIEFYRDMLVIKSIPDPKAYLDLTSEELKATVSLADGFTTEKLIHHIKTLENAYASMQRSSSVKRVTAEMALVTLTDDRLSDTPASLLSRIASIEERLASGIALQANVPIKAEQEKSAEQIQTVSKQPSNTSLSILPSWAEIINTVERTDNGSAAQLRLARGYTDGVNVIIKVNDFFSKMLLDKDDIKQLIATGINLSGDIDGITPDKIKFVHEKADTNDEDDLMSSLI